METKQTGMFLTDSTLTPIRTWNEWIDRWNAVTTFDERLGLLHVGFDVVEREGKESYEECVSFYFQIADGWEGGLRLPANLKTELTRSYAFGKNKRGEPSMRTTHELYLALAQKSLMMLSVHFFKAQTDYIKDHVAINKPLLWGWIFISPSFVAMQKFFRIERKDRARATVENLSDSDMWKHVESPIYEYFKAIVPLLWEWKEEEEPYLGDKRKKERAEENAAIRASIETSKLWIIEIFSFLKKLKIFHEILLDLDDACIAKLREIALRCELSKYKDPVKETRKVTTIEEACFAGSEAAWLIKRYQTLTTEKVRLERILEIERVKENAEKEIKDLST